MLTCGKIIKKQVLKKQKAVRSLVFAPISLWISVLLVFIPYYPIEAHKYPCYTILRDLNPGRGGLSSDLLICEKK